MKGNAIGDEGLLRLASSPNMVHLNNLNVAGTNLSIQGIQHLANSEYITCLTSLDLTSCRGNVGFRIRSIHNEYGIEVCSLIANCPNFVGLTYLNLLEDSLDEEGARMLSSSIPGLLYLMEYFEDSN